MTDFFALEDNYPDLDGEGAAARLSALVPVEVAPAATADAPMEVAARLDALWRGLAARHEWHDAQVVNMALSDLTEVVH